MKAIFKTKYLLKELNKITNIIKKQKWNESEEIILLNCEKDNCYLKSTIPFIIKIKILGEVIEVEYILKSIVTLNNEKITIEFRNEKNSPPSEPIIDPCYLDNFIKIELNEEINLQDLSIVNNFKKDETNIILNFTTDNHIQIVVESQIIKNLSYEGLKFDEPRKMIFNSKYILDVLKIASIKNFSIDKDLKCSPLFIENEKFIFLVMPKKY